MHATLDPQLIDAMHAYFRAGATLDLVALEQLYAPDFVNLRIDRAGRTIALTKAQFMTRFGQMKVEGSTYEPSDDIEFLATDRFDEYGSLLMRRVKEGAPVLYNFLWRTENGRPTAIVRELTIEEDLAGLIALVGRLQAEARSR
jgi:hypothetical protein